MPKIVRTQFLDEIINLSGNIQNYLYKNDIKYDEFCNQMEIFSSPKTRGTLKRWLRGNRVPTKENINKFLNLCGMIPNDLFLENGHSRVPFYDNIDELIKDFDSGEIGEERLNKEMIHVDPRNLIMPYGGSLEYYADDIDFYRNFEHTTFVIADFNHCITSCEGPVIVQSKENGKNYFMWQNRKMNSDIHKEPVVYVSKTLDSSKYDSVEELGEMVKTHSRMFRYNKKGNVAYSIIKLDKQYENKNKNLILTPKYYNIKKCFRCNILGILKRLGETQYTNFAHTHGLSETKFRKFLFGKETPTEEFLNSVKNKLGVYPDELCHDKGKLFVDIYTPDVIKKGFYVDSIDKIDRISTLPINEMEIDSEYCFAMENPNNELTDFNIKYRDTDNYFVIDSRYSLDKKNDNKVHLLCLIDIEENRLTFKWVKENKWIRGQKKGIFVSDSMDLEKNRIEMTREDYDNRFIQVGRVIQCYNYFSSYFQKVTTGIKSKDGTSFD